MATAERVSLRALAPAQRRVRERELVTPEGIDLKLRLADGGERFTAFLLDVVIMVAALAAFTLVALLFGIAVRVVTSEFIAAIWLLGFFFLRNFYFMTFELLPRGATPGKRVVGIRVATRDGSALTANAVFVRNAMRELELFTPLMFLLFYGSSGGWAALAIFVWCGIFLLFPLFNRDRLRIGDFVAGTWVIQAPKVKLADDLAERGAVAGVGFVFSEAQADAYGIKELSVLEDVLRRNEAATLEAVAGRIRKKIGRVAVANESDRDFLDAYYVALRKRLETRLLFGHRKRDKLDTAR